MRRGGDRERGRGRRAGCRRAHGAVVSVPEKISKRELGYVLFLGTNYPKVAFPTVPAKKGGRLRRCPATVETVSRGNSPSDGNPCRSPPCLRPLFKAERKAQKARGAVSRLPLRQLPGGSRRIRSPRHSRGFIEKRKQCRGSDRSPCLRRSLFHFPACGVAARKGASLHRPRYYKLQ